jgi:hypothetical protein
VVGLSDKSASTKKAMMCANGDHTKDKAYNVGHFAIISHLVDVQGQLDVRQRLCVMLHHNPGQRLLCVASLFCDRLEE